MSKQPKAKPPTSKSREDNRRNGKSFKTPGASRNKKNPQTAVANVLLGKGLYVTLWAKKSKA